jgi:arylsulfate sulfotransferase
VPVFARQPASDASTEGDETMQAILLMRALRMAAAVGFVLLSAGVKKAESADCTVSLEPSTSAPHLVGDRIVWVATAESCGDRPVYQFRVATGSHDRDDDDVEDEAYDRFRLVRDFSPDNAFAWTPMEEGVYSVLASVKHDFDSKETSSAVMLAVVVPRVTGQQPVVTPTRNPLVALYSAPPCRAGTMVVAFRQADVPDAPWVLTNKLRCLPGRSRNFVVAGMLPGTTYELMHVSRDELSTYPLRFTTGTPPSTLNIPPFTVRLGPGPGSDVSQNVVYHNLAGRPAVNAVNLLATDLLGRVQWYYDPLQSGLVAIGLPGSSPVRNGTILLVGRDRYRSVGVNVLREVDLAGNVLRETNIDAVNAQLKAIGQDRIYGFHHELLRLPNGNIATLGWTLRSVTSNGSPAPFVGDMLMVLDRDFQVIWTWNAFDHLDANRGPILGELCTGAPCPLAGDVDWLHDNTISWSPLDGHFLISVRHQDWVIKIDYAHGHGDGHIIWRLGQAGDFTVNSADPNPWFSHQHYPHYLTRSAIMLFDNGNTRRQTDASAHSRGQIWRLDERTMTATLLFNVDLGNYSDSLGTAERLPNGNFVFGSGSQGEPPSQFGQSIEMFPDGTPTYVLEVAAREYRTFRMSSLYSGIHR